RYSSTSTPSCFSSWRFLSAPIPAPIPAPIAVAASSGGANSPTTSPAPPPQAAPWPTVLSPCSFTSTSPLASRFITTAPTTLYSPASSPDLSVAKSSAAAPASAYEPTTSRRLSLAIAPPSVIGRDDMSGRSVHGCALTATPIGSLGIALTSQVEGWKHKLRASSSPKLDDVQ